MTTPKGERVAWWTLLAHLTATDNDPKARSLIWDMPRPLKPADMPLDMGFERAYLQVLWDVDTVRGVPYSNTVLMGLRLKFPDDAMLDKRVAEILEYTTEDRQIAPTAKMLSDILDDRLLKRIAVQVADISSSPVGNMSDKLAEILELYKGVEETSVEQHPVSNIDMLDSFIERLTQRAIRVEQGKVFSMMMPYHGLRKLAPTLEPTDMSVWSAPTKAGKTTFCMDIAEYNAWQLGVPVLYMHRETSSSSLQSRQIAKHLMIPTRAMRIKDEETQTLIVDPRKQPWTNMLAQFRERILEYEKLKAPVVYMPCGGWPNWLMEKAIRHFTEWCKRAGYDAHGVLIDYLQKMNGGGPDQRQSIAKNSEDVKTWADRYETHIILFSQDDINQGTGKASITFGSQEPMHKAQVLVSITRTESKQTVLVTEDDERGNPVIQVNALGQQRLWQKEGDGWDRRAVLRIERANDDEPGSCTVWVENPLFRIEDMSLYE